MKKITQFPFFILSLIAFINQGIAQNNSLDFAIANNNFIQWNDTNTLIESNPDFTIELWVKATTISSGSNGRMIYCEGLNSNSNMFRLFGSTGKVHIRPNGSSGAEQLSSTSTVFFASSVWKHIAVTGETPGGLGTVTTLKLYVDGILEDTGTYTRNGSDYDRSTLGNFTRTTSQTSDFGFDGEMDEFRTWSRALDATEILNNMCGPASTTGLVRHIRMNEGSGITAYDEVAQTSETISGTAVAWTTNSGCATASTADNLLENGINLYPNPVSNVLIIKNSNSTVNIKQITLLDISGKTIYTSGSVNTIDVSNLAKGMYILRITSKQGGLLHKRILVN